jgi:hypothetical protein
MGLELGPLLVGDRPILLSRSQTATTAEELLVVADNVVVEDRDVASGGLQVAVSEQGRADMNGQPVVNQVGGKDTPEVVRREPGSGEPRVGRGYLLAGPREYRRT